jgi:predicted transcriptional regulator YdeE
MWRIKMDAKMVTKPAFSVLGIEGQGPADAGPTWIGPLWNRANGRFDEIKHLTEPGRAGPQGKAWGLMSATDEFLAPWKEEGKYLAGWEVEPGTEPPEGWTVWDVPEQTFAVVACTFATYGEAFRFGLNDFLPAEGYGLAGAVHEFYPEEYRDIERDSLYLYFPVRKR